MDDRPSGGRKAPVDRTRRTGRLVRRPPAGVDDARRAKRLLRGPERLGSGRVTIAHQGWSGRECLPYGPAMRRSMGVAVAALAIALLAGCSGSGSTSSSAESAGGAGPAVAPA